MIKKNENDEMFISRAEPDSISHIQDSIVYSAEQLAGNTIDRMPDSDEYQIPFFRNIDIFYAFDTKLRHLLDVQRAPWCSAASL